MPKAILKFVSLWLLVAVVAGFFLFGFKLNERPAWHWLLLLVAGPPLVLLLQVVGEGLGELFNRLPGVRQGNDYVEYKAQGNPVSGLRIAWYLLTGLIACALVVGTTWLIRTYL
jgi:hypothetical protein